MVAGKGIIESLTEIANLKQSISGLESEIVELEKGIVRKIIETSGSKEEIQRRLTEEAGLAGEKAQITTNPLGDNSGDVEFSVLVMSSTGKSGDVVSARAKHRATVQNSLRVIS